MKIKGQTLADFIAEFTYSNTTEVAKTANNAEAVKVAEALGEKNSTLAQEDAIQWIVYVETPPMILDLGPT